MIRDEKKVETTLNGIESKTFTVEDSDKVFGIMFESLYKHVQRSIVRELWSNAWDAHKEAGNEDQPFFCQLPTPIDPTFKVRDYGIGMSHEKIMFGYSNALESDKDKTNDLVGAIGIGSKSPLAYANSYTMLAYSGETVRTYVIALNEDHIPTIHFLSENECSEPRGIEVSFAVTHNECNAFQEAAVFGSLGFPVKPITPGFTYPEPQPIFEADNLSIYNTERFPGVAHWNYGLNIFVKMGTVLYPYDTNHEFPMRIFGRKQTVVLDVPIGSVHFTPSREELRMTEKTKTYLQSAFKEIAENLESLIISEYHSAETKIKKYQSLVQWDGIITREFLMDIIKDLGIEDDFDLYKVTLNNIPLELKKATGKGFESVECYGGKKRLLSFSWQELIHKKILFVVDNNPKRTMRAYKRVVKYAAGMSIFPQSYNGGAIYYLKNPHNKDVERFVRLLGLDRDRIVNINSIPDPGADPRGKAKVDPDLLRGAWHITGSARDGGDWGFTSKVSEMPSKYYWVHIEGLTPGSVIPFQHIPEYHGWDFHFKKNYEHSLTSLLRHVTILNGDDPGTPLYVLGVQAMEKIVPNEEWELSLVVKRALEAHKQDFRKLINHNPIKSVYSNSIVEEILATDDATIASVDPNVARAFEKQHYSKIMSLYRALYKDENLEDADEHIIENKYPLLFSSHPTKEQVQEYIDFINNKETSK